MHGTKFLPGRSVRQGVASLKYHSCPHALPSAPCRAGGLRHSSTPLDTIAFASAFHLAKPDDVDVVIQVVAPPVHHQLPTAKIVLCHLRTDFFS
jgi:hypothetical protein